MDSLWMVFMSAAVVLKGLQGCFPHAAASLGATGDTAFQLACLFANPAGTLAALKGVSFFGARPQAAPEKAG
jgi:hypothetical protein